MSTLSTARIPSRCMCKFAPQKQLTSALVKCPSALGTARNICKTFGLKATQSFKASMATYKVKLICEDGSEHEFEAPNDCYILDSAENAGVELPYSCRVRWLFPGRKAGGGGLLADLRLIPDFRLRDSYSQGN